VLRMQNVKLVSYDLKDHNDRLDLLYIRHPLLRHRFLSGSVRRAAGTDRHT
jgi:hypothetical protein